MIKLKLCIFILLIVMSHMYIGNSLPTELVSKSINYKNQCSKSVVMEKCQDKRSKRSTDQISDSRRIGGIVTGIVVPIIDIIRNVLQTSNLYATDEYTVEPMVRNKNPFRRTRNY
ncbi:uncharacterized protein LOC103572557 [Microplitis demolitor]|uniref:uncharacterized protein LOC103572557 n=1 Tax=Microplitis demolitor TaxID=69319 RepID=UPI0004CD238A|nr:uncharacterized protein LOC103572557 [Microplitis demolitor]